MVRHGKSRDDAVDTLEVGAGEVLVGLAVERLRAGVRTSSRKRFRVYLFIVELSIRSRRYVLQTAMQCVMKWSTCWFHPTSFELSWSALPRQKSKSIARSV